MKRIVRYISVLLLTVLLFGCEHKELCYEHPHLVPVRVEAGWDRFCEYPMGMTVIFFPQDGTEAICVESHNPDKVSVSIPVNTYDVLVFNETMSELGSINFRNMDRLSTAEAYAYEIYSQMKMKRSVNEPIVADPERLGIAIHRDFKVTEEMLKQYRHQKELGLPIEETVLTVYPENVIYTVYVKVHVHGIYNVRSVESSLSGMAEGYMMDSEVRTSPRVTHLLTNWSAVTSESERSEGYLSASCLSFGLPSDHEGKAEENILNMSVRLVDNETVLNYAFLVGNRFSETKDDCSRILYLELGRPAINIPDDPDIPDEPDEPDDPTPDDPDTPNDPDDPGYDDPDEPIVFPDVKPEGSFDGGVSIDPSFEGDHSVEIKSAKEKKQNKE